MPRLPVKIFIKHDKPVFISNLAQNTKQLFAFVRRNFLSYITQKHTKGCASFFCYLVRTQHSHFRHLPIKHFPTLLQQAVWKRNQNSHSVNGAVKLALSVFFSYKSVYGKKCSTENQKKQCVNRQSALHVLHVFMEGINFLPSLGSQQASAAS